MQIHELNAFLGALNAGTFLAVDDGDDTGRLSIEALLRTVNERIDNIITSPAPTEQEIIDARKGWDEVIYDSLGVAIRSQLKQIMAQFYKFNTFDILSVYGTAISRTRNGVTFQWDAARQICEVTGEAVGGNAWAGIFTSSDLPYYGAEFEPGTAWKVGYSTTDQNAKLRVQIYGEGGAVTSTLYFTEGGTFTIPETATGFGVDLWVPDGATVSAVVKDVYMIQTMTAEEVTDAIRDALVGADGVVRASLGDSIRDQLDQKVDKEEGMGLSQNNFADADKTKLEDIATGAQVNIIETVKVDGTPLIPDGNKAVDIPVDDTLTEAGTPAEAKAVGEELEKKANNDGNYEEMTVGNAEQIISTVAVEDQNPYTYRQTGDGKAVGDRAYMELVGGSVVWNQLVPTNKKSGTITPSASASYYSSSVVASGAIIDHVYFMRASFNYKGDKTVTGFLQAGNLPGIEYSSTLAKNTNTTFGAVLKRPTGASTSFIIGINTVDHTINLDNTDMWDYDNLYGIDLTAALGSTIADYVYSLETATAGAGVAWFRKYFPKEYYAYCEPHFEHVQVSAKNTVGFNQFDKDNASILSGVYFGTDVILLGGGMAIVYIPCLPNTTYCASRNAVQTNERFYIGYTKEVPAPGVAVYGATSAPPSQTIGNTMAITTTTGADAKYLVVWAYWDDHTEALDTLCINLHGDRDGEYEAYQKRTYPIDPIVLRGIPKLDTNGDLYFDGDEYTHDGSGSRRMHVVSSADLTVGAYDATTGRWSLVLPNSAPTHKYTLQTEVLNMSTTYGFIVSSKNNAAAYSFAISASDASNTSSFILKLDTTQVTTVSEALAWVQAHPFDLMYEVATPEPFAAEPFQYPMVVDPLGTEEFADYGVAQGTRDVAVPVGHVTEYPADLRTKLERLPNAADSDGRFCVQQTNGQMTLVPDTSPGLIAALEARVAALEGGGE